MSFFGQHAKACTPRKPCAMCTLDAALKAKLSDENYTAVVKLIDAAAHVHDFECALVKKLGASTAELLHQEIDTVIELSVHSVNVLSAANIRTVMDLVRKTEHEILGLENSGRKTLNELKESLAPYGLYLGMKL